MENQPPLNLGGNIDGIDPQPYFWNATERQRSHRGATARRVSAPETERISVLQGESLSKNTKKKKKLQKNWKIH